MQGSDQTELISSVQKLSLLSYIIARFKQNIPGILCISPHLQKGDRVSIFADVQGKCLRGSKTFSGKLFHVGEGVLNVSREELFRTGVPVTGVGVSVTHKIFPCPSLSESAMSGTLMLQNLPSIIAVDILGKGALLYYYFIISSLHQILHPGRECSTCAPRPGGRQPTSPRGWTTRGS